MKNNNSAIIRKITWRTIGTDRKRNFFVIAAIMLTTVLLAAAFSIGISMLESIKLQKIRMAGSIAQAYITNPTKEQLVLMKGLDYIEEVGVGIGVGSISDRQSVGNIDLTLVYIDSTQWEKVNKPAFSDITGSYPMAENEIMLSCWILEHMGITEPELGMTISLPYTVGRDSEIVCTGTFILSGYFKNYYYVNSGGADYALVSEDLSDRYGCTADRGGTANILFKANNRKYYEQLQRDIVLTENQQFFYSDPDMDSGSYISTFIVLILLSLIFMVCGYLLIYNTMLMSLSRDIRYYGQLKTIGMTPRQIRRIVLYTVNILCVVGICPGLVIAALVSRIIVPDIIVANGVFTGAVISHSPVIYLGSVIFAYVTALAAALTPAKKAARVSPVEGSRYSESIAGAVSIKSCGRVSKPVNMAVRNIFRSGKRCVLVLAGMSLSMMILILTSVTVSSLNAEKYAESMLDCDIRLENAAAYVTIGTNIFSDDLIDSIHALSGLDGIQIITEAMCEANYDGNSFLESDTYVSLFGIDKEAILRLNETWGLTIDAEAFERGEFVILEAYSPKQWQSIRNISGELTTGVVERGRSFELPLGAVIPSGSIIGTKSEIQLFVSNSYLNSIADALQIKRIDLNFEKDYDEEAYNILRESVRSDNNISLLSRYEIKQSIKESIVVLFILGGSISLVLGIIGILNYINVMAVGVISRMRELAILECVGMERRQVRKMLLLEGVGYGLMSLLIGNVLGNILVAISYLWLFNRIEYMDFNYPLILLMIYYAVILLICIATPLMVYRSINRTTVSERLRQIE